MYSVHILIFAQICTYYNYSQGSLKIKSILNLLQNNDKKEIFMYKICHCNYMSRNFRLYVITSHWIFKKNSILHIKSRTKQWYDFKDLFGIV